MRITKTWMYVYGSMLPLGLILLSVTGCATTYPTKPYSPAHAPLYQVPQQTLDLPSLGVSYAVAVFESEHLARVDVENNIGSSYDCRSFGKALRDDLANKLWETGRLTRVSSPKIAGKIRVSGRVNSITVRNNMGYLGPGPSASGTVTYEVRVAGVGTEFGYRDIVNAEVLYPKPGADFHLAIDALRLQLAHNIAKRIAEDKRLPEIAALARSKGSRPQYSSQYQTPYVNEVLASTIAERPSLHSRKELVAERWAVIIGISSYQDTRIPSLRYASKDARALYDWLISSDGGKYSPSRVRLMIDQEATGMKMKEVLFDWLKQAIEEDMVTIYFAGHGSPESPDSPENLFLLPYDVKYDSISSTGFPMWDIETALKRFIKARKVVVIADACHAGGVGQSFDIARRANRGIKINPISSGLTNLSNVSDGVAIFSASSDNQFSHESNDWGGGHGVFTYFLLEGLNGRADYNKDQSVNLGELSLYLSEQVRRATKNAQSPIVSGKFDPALTIGK